MPEYENGKSTALGLLKIMSGYRATQVIYVAAQLRIADFLDNGPMSVINLAEAIDADPRFLLPVMRALAHLGIFRETTESVFDMTPLSMPLRSDDKDSIRATALSWGDETSWKPWGELLFSVKTGKPAFQHIFGVHPFEYVSKSDIFNDTLSQAMTGGADRLSAEILEGYDFSRMSKIVDVGGGHGSLMSAILRRHPNIKGVVFDRPSVADGARKNLESKGLSERCEVVDGSFFDSVPNGGDGYILCRTIHDWDDDRAASILKNCRRSMQTHAKLIVVEGMVRSVGDKSPTTLSDVNMILMGGLERTSEEFETLFNVAGFSMASVTPIGSGLSVIEGDPV